MIHENRDLKKRNDLIDEPVVKSQKPADEFDFPPLQLLAKTAASVFHAPYVFIWLAHNKDSIRFLADYLKSGYPAIDEPEALVETLITLKKPFFRVYEDETTPEEYRFKERWNIQFAASAQAAHTNGDCIGICVMDNNFHQDSFNKDQIILNNFALLALALNPPDGSPNKNSVQSTENFAASLQEIAVMLNRSLDIDVILDRMSVLIERVVPYDTAAIILLDGDEAVEVRYYGKSCYLQVSEPATRYNISEIPILETMHSNRKAIILRNTVDTLSWIQKPHLGWVRSYLGAPIQLENQVIGFLNLNSAQLDFFQPIHAQRLQAFADQAATAIQNAKLFRQAQNAAALEERQRLARDLHDAVSQTLWTASIIAEVLPALWEKDQEDAKLSLDHLRRLTKGALAEMRSLLLELRPAALEKTSLIELLEQLTQTTMSRRNIEIKLQVNPDFNPNKILSDVHKFTPEVKTGLYRIAQEALNNIAKHARASHVSLVLDRIGEQLQIHIIDDGQGFDNLKAQSTQMGIGIMCERAAEIGARLEISSTPGLGTNIDVIWPDFSNTSPRRSVHE